MGAPRFQLRTVAVREDGCFSVLCFAGRPFAVTCERTFENMRTVITNGTFHCVKTDYHKGGYPTYEIIVPGHSRVLFHRGNVETDSEACILVAESFAQLGGVTSVADSKGGFAEFMLLAQDANGNQVAEFDLTVTGR